MNLGADFVWTEEELRKTPVFREKKMSKPKLALNCVGGQSGTEILKCLSNGGLAFFVVKFLFDLV